MDTSNKKESTESKKIVSLTEPAVAKVKAMMLKEGKEGFGLRVGVIPGGCAGLSYELRFQRSAYDNDIVVDQGDLKIFVNQESVAFLNGTQVDYIETLKESGFKYHNPNTSSSCGCGTSFS